MFRKSKFDKYCATLRECEICVRSGVQLPKFDFSKYKHGSLTSAHVFKYYHPALCSCGLPGRTSRFGFRTIGLASDKIIIPPTCWWDEYLKENMNISNKPLSGNVIQAKEYNGKLLEEHYWPSREYERRETRNNKQRMYVQMKNGHQVAEAPRKVVHAIAVSSSLSSDSEIAQLAKSSNVTRRSPMQMKLTDSFETVSRSAPVTIITEDDSTESPELEVDARCLRQPAAETNDRKPKPAGKSPYILAERHREILQSATDMDIDTNESYEIEYNTGHKTLPKPDEYYSYRNHEPLTRCRPDTNIHEEEPNADEAYFCSDNMENTYFGSYSAEDDEHILPLYEAFALLHESDEYKQRRGEIAQLFTKNYNGLERHRIFREVTIEDTKSAFNDTAHDLHPTLTNLIVAEIMLQQPNVIKYINSAAPITI
jgi:hypothetical protein